MTQVFTWRSTFLTVNVDMDIEVAPPRRARSAPPAEAYRCPGPDLFATEKSYAACMSERAGQHFGLGAWVAGGEDATYMEGTHTSSFAAESMTEQQWQQENLCRFRKKKGVRCERASALLKRQLRDDGAEECPIDLQRLRTTSTQYADGLSSDSEDDHGDAPLRDVTSMAKAILGVGNPSRLEAARQRAGLDVQGAPRQGEQPPPAARATAQSQDTAMAKQPTRAWMVAASESESVPELQLQGAMRCGDDTCTTFMICNLPCRVKRDELEQVLQQVGLQDRYDYLHLPMSGRPASNIGYAFINLCEPCDAELLISRLTGYKFEGTVSKKTVGVRPARLQGLQNNIDQFRSQHRRKQVLAQADAATARPIAPC